jgi:hypothetical protein
MIMERVSMPRPEATLDQALSAARGHAGPLLVDLDETLYLRNSTEDFIDTAVPAPLALLLIRILDVVKPWRWTGGDATRDVWRVRLISMFFPWTRARWRRRVLVLGPRFRNEALANALKSRGQPFTVVTLGFAQIVAPLVEAMDLGDRELIACDLQTASHRVRGKLAMVRKFMDEATVAEAAVISDSGTDEDLFSACGNPLLVRWRNAAYRPALQDVYLPGQYLDRIKRPGSGALKSVLVDDFPLWVLASLPLVLTSGWGFIGIACLFVSFWAVYEVGYIENDQVAARFESEPQLTAQFRQFDLSTIGFRPWIYAACMGSLGVLCLHHASWFDLGLAGASWVAVLLGTRVLYRLYNYSDKQTRAWLYLGLQALRVGTFAAVAPMNPVGALAAVARAASRWQIYLMYRKVRGTSGYDWTPLPERTIALALFGMLMLFGAFSGFVGLSSAGLCMLFLLWGGILARRELVNVVGGAHMHKIDEPLASGAGQASRS